MLGQLVLTARPTVRDRADEDVFHRDNQVLERVLARLAHHQFRVLQMLAVATGQIQVRRRDVDELRERQVVHVDFAGSGTAAHVG